jgi:hypothetical protein
MMVTVGLINSLIRIIGDPYLRFKLYQVIVTRRLGTRDLSVNEEDHTEVDLNSEAYESISHQHLSLP